MVNHYTYFIVLLWGLDIQHLIHNLTQYTFRVKVYQYYILLTVYCGDFQKYFKGKNARKNFISPICYWSIGKTGCTGSHLSQYFSDQWGDKTKQKQNNSLQFHKNTGVFQEKIDIDKYLPRLDKYQSRLALVARENRNIANKSITASREEKGKNYNCHIHIDL